MALKFNTWNAVLTSCLIDHLFQVFPVHLIHTMNCVGMAALPPVTILSLPVFVMLHVLKGASVTLDSSSTEMSASPLLSVVVCMRAGTTKREPSSTLQTLVRRSVVVWTMVLLTATSFPVGVMRSAGWRMASRAVTLLVMEQ